jgi:hypothetical protein
MAGWGRLQASPDGRVVKNACEPQEESADSYCFDICSVPSSPETQ